jgi:hypothetical protein
MSSARAGYISGIFPVWGIDMPVFLYEDYKYNPEDPEEGLFRGAFLVCVSPDIFYYFIVIHLRWHPNHLGTH